MSEYLQTDPKRIRNGITQHVSDELLKQADDFINASLPTAMAAYVTKDEGVTRTALGQIKDRYTPAVALVVGAAPIFTLQTRMAGQAAYNCIVAGVGPVAVQHVIAQWLFEHPEVMAQIVSDPRWEHAI